ncbi:MAG TPA: hypothetical protein VHM26_09790, partial [Chitinophagaceae bacterium]|nr:hypothetical protein [Chitinophagaceae bacterium]
ISSCTKSSNEEKDQDAPVILRVTPPDNAVFTGSQNLSIDGTIVDDNLITEVHFHIYNAATNALLLDIHRTPGGNGYTMHETISVVTGTQYRIQIRAKDKFGNEGVDTNTITVN